MKIEIACPKCNWEPDGGKHWQCSCGHIWNTFETFAKCPKCAKTWEDTICPPTPGGCDLWSKHLDWYRNLDSLMKEEIKKIFKEELVNI